MSIAAGITATKATLDVAKILSDLVNRPNIDAADVRGKLHELLIHAVNAQTALAEAQLEMSELRNRLQEQNRLKEIDADLEMDLEGRYLVRKSEKERGLIPYCPTCWGGDTKLVPLTLIQQPGAFKCAVHDVFFESPEHLEHKRRRNEEAKQHDRRRPGTYGWMG
jgi:hypothetical protein